MGRGIKEEGVNLEVDGHTWDVESQGREAPGSRIYLKPYSQSSKLICSILTGRPAPEGRFYVKHLLVVVVEDRRRHPHCPASSFQDTASRQAKTIEFLCFFVH